MKCCKNLAWTLVAVVVLWAAAPGAHAKLIGYWPFDDGPGSGTAVDLSGNGNDGVVMGTAEFVNEGKIGGAIDFGEGGNDAWVQIPSAADGAFNSIVDTQSATVAFWMNRKGDAATSQWTFALDGGDTGSDPVTGRQISGHAPWSNGIIYMDTGGCCNADQRINTELPEFAISGNEWVHLAFVRDVADTRIYLNGEVLVESEPGAITSPVSPIIRAGIGAAPDGTNSQSGMLDDFAIWDEALAPSAIAALAAGAPVPEPSSIVLIILGAFGLLVLRRRR